MSGGKTLQAPQVTRCTPVKPQKHQLYIMMQYAFQEWQHYCIDAGRHLEAKHVGTFKARASSASSTASPVCAPAARSSSATSSSMSLSGENLAANAAVVLLRTTSSRPDLNSKVGASRFACTLHCQCQSQLLCSYHIGYCVLTLIICINVLEEQQKTARRQPLYLPASHG